jgi:dTDP-4-dehydrorhamnose reductase
MTKPRLLVTGGSGYLGGWVSRIASGDWDVTATYASHAGTDPGAAWRELDVRDEGRVASLVDEIQPQVVIHTAALNPGQGNDFAEVNVAGTAHIAQAAAGVGARLVHISTDMVFDGRRGNYTEADSPTPLTPYGETKAGAEQAVTEAGAEAVIVRTSLVYGWRPTIARAAQWMIDTVDRGESLELWSNEMRCPIWVESLAEAVVEVAGLNYTGVLHIAGTQAVSRYDFGRALLRFHGLDTSEVFPMASPPEAGRPLDCTMDCSLALSLLTTPLPGVDEVLARGDSIR